MAKDEGQPDIEYVWNENFTLKQDHGLSPSASALTSVARGARRLRSDDERLLSIETANESRTRHSNRHVLGINVGRSGSRQVSKRRSNTNVSNPDTDGATPCSSSTGCVSRTTPTNAKASPTKAKASPRTVPRTNGDASRSSRLGSFVTDGLRFPRRGAKLVGNPHRNGKLRSWALVELD